MMMNNHHNLRKAPKVIPTNNPPPRFEWPMSMLYADDLIGWTNLADDGVRSQLNIIKLITHDKQERAKSVNSDESYQEIFWYKFLDQLEKEDG